MLEPAWRKSKHNDSFMMAAKWVANVVDGGSLQVCSLYMCNPTLQVVALAFIAEARPR
jgi:hypothetical protein